MVKYRKNLLMAGLALLLFGMSGVHGVEARHGHGAETVVVTDVSQSIPYRQRNSVDIDREHPSVENILQHWRERHGKEAVDLSTRPASRTVPENAMRLWQVRSVSSGGTLLFSDSPESVMQDGILYSDSVSGDARILFYHLNSTGEPKKVAVVVENISGQLNSVHVTRGGMSDPDSDYLSVGKATQTEYFNTTLHDSMYLLNGNKRLLQAKMDQIVLQPGELVYGVYDFTAAHPVKVTVIMYPEWENPIDFLSHATVLPKDEQRLRGTFYGMNRTISSAKSYDPSRDGIVYFPIGDNEHDLYLWGVDATDGSKVINYGNYGVLYQIQIPTKGKQKMRYFLSPLGGVYAGAMTVKQNGGRSSLLLTPCGRTYFGDATPDIPQPEEWKEKGITFLEDYTELADLGTYQSSAKVSFEYSPPGASNLPVNIILMPESAH